MNGRIARDSVRPSRNDSQRINVIAGRLPRS